MELLQTLKLCVLAVKDLEMTAAVRAKRRQ